jgi:hypothetical protein
MYTMSRQHPSLKTVRARMPSTEAIGVLDREKQLGFNEIISFGAREILVRERRRKELRAARRAFLVCCH